MTDIKEKVILVVNLLNKNKAQDIKIFSFEKNDISAYCIIASGRIERQVNALADILITELKKVKYKPYGFEGTPEGRWVVLDYLDFIVHIFEPETRMFYNIVGLLEKVSKCSEEIE